MCWLNVPFVTPPLQGSLQNCSKDLSKAIFELSLEEVEMKEIKSTTRNPRYNLQIRVY